MMEVFFSYKSAINEVINEMRKEREDRECIKDISELTKQIISPLMWTFIEDLIQIFRPVRNTTVNSQDAKDATLSLRRKLVQVTILEMEAYQFQTTNQEKIGDLNVIRNYLTNHLKALVVNSSITDLERIATILDCRCWKLEKNDPEKYQSLIRTYLEKLGTSSAIAPQLPVKRAINGDIKLVLSVTERIERLEQQTPVDDVQQSIESFYNEIEEQINPLDWWKKNELKYPLLIKLAYSYLCPPLTSASCERLFSIGARIATPYRGSLKEDVISKLMYLKFNSNLIK